MILSICCLIPEPPCQQLTPFDLTKKKKKTFVVQDAIEDSAESHGRHTIRCLIVQEEFIEITKLAMYQDIKSIPADG
ncbi:hypothetical protein F2Q68_00043260 [Brassica cretica]|uniref:Uncharacterized protein n=1 Tax=Brassica cretica TaxID=69181 RepID=A0A8S9LN21_BRACR|nr:hypothetical protein F2Q68_00043260 [Brassica cretica]